MKHKVSEVKLKNGARGLIVNVPDALVMTFDFNFRAGEYLVDPKKWEIPHLMEHVLLGANELIPRARDFHAELEKNGAYSNASTGVYDIDYEAECADFEWERILDLLLISISKPLFLENEFKSEFGNVKEELKARSNNHFRKLSLRMRQEVGFISKTDEDRLKIMDNVKLEDIKEHYTKTHLTSNMRFVIGGNLGSDRLTKLLDKIEAINLPRGVSRFKLPNEVPKRIQTPLLIEDRSVNNIYFYIDTFLKHQLAEHQNDTLNLLNTYLTETLYSKILGTARERGLLYDMSSGNYLSKLSTNWWFGAQVSENNISELFDIFISEISKVRRGDINLDDIESTKQYIIGRFQRSAQTVFGTANGYSYRYFFDGVIDNYSRYPNRIKAITKDLIIEVANLMFTDKVWILGLLGNTSREKINELENQISVLWR